MADGDIRMIPPPRRLNSASREAMKRRVMDEMAAIREAETRERRPKKWRRSVVSVLVAATILGASGIAAARAGLFGPDPDEANVVEETFEAEESIHPSGWRPELDAERVLCDYSEVNPAAPTVETPASDFPLTEPMTAMDLIRECRSGTDLVRDSEPTAEATICTVRRPGDRRAIPAVVFGSTCAAAGYTPPPDDLMATLNARRRLEVSLKAIPQECPSRREVIDWVRQTLAHAGEELSIVTPGRQYSGPPCHRADVSWRRGVVMVS